VERADVPDPQIVLPPDGKYRNENPGESTIHAVSVPGHVPLLAK